MSFDSEKRSLGREPVMIVEIDADYCTLTYGAAPCTAVVGVTGSQKCFNTRKTCQSTANYVIGVKTYRFSNRELRVASKPLSIVASGSPTMGVAGGNVGGTATNAKGFVEYTWEKVSGPGAVAFGDASALNTTVSFGSIGTYSIKITVSDDNGSASSILAITVT